MRSIEPTGLCRRFLRRTPDSACDDYKVLLEALTYMFEHDRSAARGEMSLRGLGVFEHETALGNAPLTSYSIRFTLQGLEIPRSFADYRIGGPENVAGGSEFSLGSRALNAAMFSEDDLLPLSGLQHLMFCERQWGLIHIEQLWEENRLTAEGRVLHERAHQAGTENRPNVRTSRGLRLHSLRLGIGRPSRRSGVSPLRGRRRASRNWRGCGVRSRWSISAGGLSGMLATKSNSARRRCAWRKCLAERSPKARSITGSRRRRTQVGFSAVNFARGRKPSRRVCTNCTAPGRHRSRRTNPNATAVH